MSESTPTRAESPNQIQFQVDDSELNQAAFEVSPAVTAEQVIGSVATGESATLDVYPDAVPSPMSRAARKVVNGRTIYLVPGRSLLIKFKDLKK